MSDPPEGIPHAEDTFEAGYAAAARVAVARARPGILAEAARACERIARDLPARQWARKRQARDCALTILALVEKEGEG